MENKMLSRADCRNCFLRKGEICTQLRNDPCSDFKPLPIITREERACWPDIMDASYIRMYGSHRG